MMGTKARMNDFTPDCNLAVCAALLFVRCCWCQVSACLVLTCVRVEPHCSSGVAITYYVAPFVEPSSFVVLCFFVGR